MKIVFWVWSNARIIVNMTVIFTKIFTMKYSVWNEFRLLYCQLSIRSVFTHEDIKLLLIVFWEFNLRQETLIQRHTVISWKTWFSFSITVEASSLAFILSLNIWISSDTLFEFVTVNEPVYWCITITLTKKNEWCILWCDNLQYDILRNAWIWRK
jgi:hypothetical protein